VNVLFLNRMSMADLSPQEIHRREDLQWHWSQINAYKIEARERMTGYQYSLYQNLYRKKVLEKIYLIEGGDSERAEQDRMREMRTDDLEQDLNM
jgi:hypothetical protein